MVRGARYCLQRDISIGIGLFQAVCVCTLSDLRSFGLRSRRRPLWVFFSRSAASATRQYVRPRMLVVLPVGIEPTTSPLPRECSTTELRQPLDPTAMWTQANIRASRGWQGRRVERRSTDRSAVHPSLESGLAVAVHRLGGKRFSLIFIVFIHSQLYDCRQHRTTSSLTGC
jgi:hypothetical protein